MRSARVLGVLLALFAALPADAREFRSSDIYPFDYPTVQAVVQVDKLMRERSGGKLGITVLGYDDRDSENYTAAQVRNGQLDMARLNLAVLNNLVPSTAIFALPYLFKSKEHTRRILDGPIGEEILAGLEGAGTDRAGLLRRRAAALVQQQEADPHAGRHVWHARARAAGRYLDRHVPRGRRQAGGRADRSRLLTLQSGLVDASEHNWPSYVTLRHYQVAPYFSMTGHSMAPAVLVFSKRVWDTL